jgi:hypothetical protein
MLEARLEQASILKKVRDVFCLQIQNVTLDRRL